MNECLKTDTLSIEFAVERNGQWFAIGNRTLAILNLAHNDFHEHGWKALMDAILEQQQQQQQQTTDIMNNLGLLRINVTVCITAMIALLLSPTIEHTTHYDNDHIHTMIMIINTL